MSLAASWQSLFADQPGHAPVVGLRAIACLWVTWFHAVETTGWDTLGMTLDSPPPGKTLGARLQAWWWPIGAAMAGDAGVDLFFVLSGFLLGGLLLHELTTSEQIHAVRFYLRRWFRIVPAYVCTMVLYALLREEDQKPEACPSLWWMNLLFINNLFVTSGLHPACLVHTWYATTARASNPETQCFLHAHSTPK